MVVKKSFNTPISPAGVVLMGVVAAAMIVAMVGCFLVYIQ